MGLFSSECGHCGSKEHATSDCPHGFLSTECGRCGSKDHATSDCPHGVFSSECGHCGSKEHATSDCPHGLLSSECGHCGSSNHSTSDCPHGLFSSKCGNCGSEDHATSDCPHGLFSSSRSHTTSDYSDYSSSDSHSDTGYSSGGSDYTPNPLEKLRDGVIILIAGGVVLFLWTTFANQCRVTTTNVRGPGRASTNRQQLDACGEHLRLAQASVRVKQWDDAYAAVLDALKCNASFKEAEQLRAFILTKIRSDSQYFGSQFRKLRTFGNSTSEIRSMDFSQDGKLLVTRHWDKLARTWNFNSGSLIRTARLNTSVFSRDRDRRQNFEMRSMDGSEIARVESKIGMEIRIFSSSTGRLIRSRLILHGSIELSPDLKTIVVASVGITGMMTFVDMATGKDIRYITMAGYPVPRFTPDGKWLAVGRSDGDIEVWGVADR
jgi:WD40 repeat protein